MTMARAPARKANQFTSRVRWGISAAPDHGGSVRDISGHDEISDSGMRPYASRKGRAARARSRDAAWARNLADCCSSISIAVATTMR